jgi:hypothetical protein
MSPGREYSNGAAFMRTRTHLTDCGDGDGIGEAVPELFLRRTFPFR